MADEQAATQGEWLWGDDPLDDPRPPGSAFDEPLQWPDAMDWPPPPLPLGDLDFQAPAAAPEAPAAAVPPPPSPIEPLLEPLDFDPGPVDDVAAPAAAPAPAAEPEVAEPPADADLIPTSIWGPASALRSEPADPGPPVTFGDTPAPAVEDTQLSVQPIPESFWDEGAHDDPPVAPPVGPRPRIYAEPERTHAGGAAAWFQMRHPTAAMAGLAVFVVLVVVGLVLSVRNKPDASVTDAAQKGGAISAQRLPSTTVIPTTTTATTTPVAVIDLQPPGTDPGATPADVGGQPASNGTAPAGGRTATATPTTRAAAPASGGGGGSSGGGGGSSPAATTGTTAAPAAPDTTQPPATSPPDTTPASTSPPSTRRTTTIPPDFTVPSITTPTTQAPPTTPTSFDFTVPTRPR